MNSWTKSACVKQAYKYVHKNRVFTNVIYIKHVDNTVIRPLPQNIYTKYTVYFLLGRQRLADGEQ